MSYLISFITGAIGAAIVCAVAYKFAADYIEDRLSSFALTFDWSGPTPIAEEDTAVKEACETAVAGAVLPAIVVPVGLDYVIIPETVAPAPVAEVADDSTTMVTVAESAPIVEEVSAAYANVAIDESTTTTVADTNWAVVESSVPLIEQAPVAIAKIELFTGGKEEEDVSDVSSWTTIEMVDTVEAAPVQAPNYDDVGGNVETSEDESKVVQF